MKTPAGAGGAGGTTPAEVLKGVAIMKVKSRATMLAERLAPLVCAESDLASLLLALKRELICNATCRGAFLTVLKSKGIAIAAEDAVELQTELDSMVSYPPARCMAYFAMRVVLWPGGLSVCNFLMIRSEYTLDSNFVRPDMVSV